MEGRVKHLSWHNANASFLRTFAIESFGYFEPQSKRWRTDWAKSNTFPIWDDMLYGLSWDKLRLSSSLAFHAPLYKAGGRNRKVLRHDLSISQLLLLLLLLLGLSRWAPPKWPEVGVTKDNNSSKSRRLRRRITWWWTRNHLYQFLAVTAYKYKQVGFQVQKAFRERISISPIQPRQSSTTTELDKLHTESLTSEKLQDEFRINKGNGWFE